MVSLGFGGFASFDVVGFKMNEIFWRYGTEMQSRSAWNYVSCAFTGKYLDTVD